MDPALQFDKSQVAGIAVSSTTGASLASLARLGVDTGGTLTERSNDSILALNTALNRLSCVYSLGFRDSDLSEARRKSLSVSVRGNGLRAAHAAAYELRTEAMRRESLVRAAYVSPQSFDTGGIRAAVQRLRPASRRDWSAQIAVNVDLEDAPAPGRNAELGIVLSRGSSVVREVARTISLEDAAEHPFGNNALTFLEPITLPPGKYVLSTVVFDSATQVPRSTQVAFEIPGVPRDGPFLVGPLLGRRRGDGRVIRGVGGDSQSSSQRSIGNDVPYVPLVGARIDGPSDVILVTQVCDVARDDGITARRVGRALRSPSGSLVGEFEPQRISLDGREAVRCGGLVDVVPSSTLAQDGEYTFEARFVEDAAAPIASARFWISGADALNQRFQSAGGP